MEDWILFFSRLGGFLSGSAPQDDRRLNVILSVPILDYASLITALGVICQRFEDRSDPFEQLEEWREREGLDVVFPLLKKYHYQGNRNDVRKKLVRKEGVVDTVVLNQITEKPALQICYHKSSGGKVEKDWKYFLPPELLPLVSEIETTARIDSVMRGSIIAEDIGGLEQLLGLKGAIEMLGSKHKICCLYDTKTRVYDEVSEDISIGRLTGESTDEMLLMRDAVRFRRDGREAVRDSSSCRVLRAAEPDWPVAIFSGSVNLLRFWDECDSPVRIGFISPVEPSYNEAVEFSNTQFRRRSQGPEFTPSQDLVGLMPSTVDAQFFYSSQ